MSSNTLDDLYFTAVRKMGDGESRIVEALADFHDNIVDGELKKTVETHRQTIHSHSDRLKEILKQATDNTLSLHNFGVDALIEEAHAVNKAYGQGVLRDIALATIGQHIVHYKIACYGALTTYAKTLGRDADAESLGQTLSETKAIDDELNGIAHRLVADAQA